MRIRNVAVAFLLLAALCCAGWWAFTAYHRQRARRLAVLLEEVALSERFDLRKFREFEYLKSECNESGCQYGFDESNYAQKAFEFYGRHQFPRWPSPFVVVGSVTVTGNGDFRHLTVLVADDSSDYRGNQAIIQIHTSREKDFSDRCVSERLHSGLKVGMLKGILIVSVASTASEAVKREALALNWDCLGSPGGCRKSENLIRRVATYLESDRKWEDAHPLELQELLKTCHLPKN